ncbi:MAG: glycerophosphodiester phosphodiesterase [Acidobacteria bacterium]|nr:glycerophosphodiester phosphodiesterase [Acidobacteriota bacterium]
MVNLHAIEVHGHRGARAVLPENSLPAFAYALEQGVDVLELDMAVTKDEVVVVSHDAVMNPKLCTGPKNAERAIHKQTWRELQRWTCGTLPHADFPDQRKQAVKVPRLDDVFKLAAKTKVHFNIETKLSPKTPDLAPGPERFAELVLQAVRKHKLESRVILQSFDFRTLHAMKKLEPRVRLSALFPYDTAQRGADYLEIAKESGAGILSPHFSTVTPEKVAAAHNAGLTVVPWTANTPDQWQKLVDAKSDAIISDDPAALIAWLKSKGLR